MSGIPILNLYDQTERLWPEIIPAIERVIRAGQFILGPEVQAFEAEAARYLEVKYAIGVNSGTDALVIALRAAGIGTGDEVITTPFTFFATAEAVSTVGATPVFVDIDPLTFNINTKLIEGAITPRTRAILPVHLYGQPADMDGIMAIARKYNLVVIEDVAQAFGGKWREKKLGTIGKLGCFSFFPTKNLSCFGDGGMVVTDDDDLAEQVLMLRAHGSKKKYHNEILGYNSRLDEIQAAILRVKLPYVDKWNEARRRAAQRYHELLAEIPGLELPLEKETAYHVYHQYTIRIKQGKRDLIKERLEKEGICTMIYYPIPLHKLPVYNRSEKYANAEAAAGEVLSLPIWPEITPAIQERVAVNIRRIMEEIG